MKILFIGYSSLFKRRILPYLDKLPFEEVHIAKYKNQEWDHDYKKYDTKIVTYDSYEDGFKNAKVDICYISSINADHFISAVTSLRLGFHTIIDKPATLNIRELNILFSLANENNILLAESTVYTYHPQFTEIKKIFEEQKSKIQVINTMFSFPPLGYDNFRYNRSTGGGAINDTSPYAASIGRYFFNELPDKVHTIINGTFNDVETSYSIVMQYPNGQSMIGHFGFTTEYVNDLTLLGENIKVSISRTYTIPPSSKTSIKVRSKNAEWVVDVESANVFLLFFEDIIKTIESSDYIKFTHRMIMDAKIRNLILK